MSKSVRFGRSKSYKPLKCAECLEEIGNSEAHAINGKIMCDNCFKETVTGDKVKAP